MTSLPGPGGVGGEKPTARIPPFSPGLGGGEAAGRLAEVTPAERELSSYLR